MLYAANEYGKLPSILFGKTFLRISRNCSRLLYRVHRNRNKIFKR